MSRKEQLRAFMDKYQNISFHMSNIPHILENLQKAEQDGCLRKFLMNEKPYISAFPLVLVNDKTKAARGKDQVALVFALNLYGAKNPGFAARLNVLLKELGRGSLKEAQNVMVLMRAQMELQQLEISLINFLDRELLEIINQRIKAVRGKRILLMLLCILGGAVAMPGSAMLGLFPLTFVGIGVFLYGFVKIFYWIALIPYQEADIQASARPIGECTEESE